MCWAKRLWVDYISQLSLRSSTAVLEARLPKESTAEWMKREKKNLNENCSDQMERISIAKDSIHPNCARFQPQFLFNQKALELKENNVHEVVGVVIVVDIVWCVVCSAEIKFIGMDVSRSHDRRRRRWRRRSNNHAFGVTSSIWTT